MDRKEILECYERQKDRVYKFACFTCKNVTMAEDVFQDVFYKYMLKQPRFKDDDHETAWFIRVTINACRDVLKSKWNKARLELEEWDGKEDPMNEPEEWEILRDAVKNLPEKYRAVIYLYYYEEYSTKEIAEILRRRETTVRTQLQRGREQLKEILEERRKSHGR